MRELHANRRRFLSIWQKPALWQKHAVERIQAFAADSSGVTVVEYGLIAAAIASAVLAVTTLLQSSLVDLAKELSAALTL